MPPIRLPDAIYIAFLFALGACLGSFLNVVVWRLPRNESLITPPSHCPKCNHKLAWFDNIPVFGWIMLRGKCRYCSASISMRYPIIEAITGLLFVFYYVMFFMLQIGPCAQRDMTFGEDWPMYALYMFLIAGLLAASLIDAELFIIPIEIPWIIAFVAIVVHTIIDQPNLPGTLNASPPTAALAAGAGLGLMMSIAAWLMGWLPTSFPHGEPILEVDRESIARELEEAKRKGEQPPPLPPPYTKQQIRAEMRKEMIFLMPPLIVGGAWLEMTQYIGPVHNMWEIATRHAWFTGLLGAVLGGLVGGFVVWITRILGTLGFGKVAMGLGDVHLMFCVGAVIGAAQATVVFFLAPFFGILVALYLLFTRTRRELPYGPYLSLATGFVILFGCEIVAAMSPGMIGLGQMLHAFLAPAQ